MSVASFCSSFAGRGESAALVWRDRPWTYAWLAQAVLTWQERIRSHGIGPGAVVSLEADFSPTAVALWLALVDSTCIVLPLAGSVAAKKSEFCRIAEAEFACELTMDDEARVRRTGGAAHHPLYQTLRAFHHPGLVLFSSGSTGASKGVVHDLAPLLEKYRAPRPPQRAIAFLLFDHIGGVNTMLHLLANGGCLVTVAERTPDAVLAAIQRHRVELLPTSPTFINLILLSEAWKRYDLSSLRTVTYGTEPMPESTLRRFHEIFPLLRLQQTYGLSEIGILRSQSRSSDSLWVRLGGEGFETRVVDGCFQVKSRSAMLGYLNAPSPFTADGWLNTGDLVEVSGEFVRFLGRKSEVINVGGEKVHPSEVESVLQSMDNVAEARAYGEKNPITGAIVCADVVLLRPEDPRVFTARLKQFCRERLQNYQVPVKVRLLDGALHGDRFKKVRAPN